MIFICTDPSCQAAAEGETRIRCPRCGKPMKSVSEEALTGDQWCELGIFWRDRQTEEADLRAIECFRQAAKRGSACGISNLGICMEYGFGTKSDIRQAFWLYRQAAEYE